MNGYDIHDRTPITWHVIFTLIEPMSHISHVVGNVSHLRTLPVLTPEGNTRPVFALSGNAIRGNALRRKGTGAALDFLGVEVNPDIHQTLFAGGRIDGSSGNNMELDTRIRQAMPWLSVLGAAKPTGVFGESKSQMIPGRLEVGNAYLRCYESCLHLYRLCPRALPLDSLDLIGELVEVVTAAENARFGGGVADMGNSTAYKQAKDRLDSVRREILPVLRRILRTYSEHLCFPQFTRRDSTNDSALQQFLLPVVKEQALIEGAKGEEKKPREKSDQMIMQDTLLASGSTLASRWDGRLTAVEEGFVYSALLEWGKEARFGGKGNKGMGLCSVDVYFSDRKTKEQGKLMSFGAGLEQLSDRATDRKARYEEHLHTFRSFLEEHGSEARGLLQ